MITVSNLIMHRNHANYTDICMHLLKRTLSSSFTGLELGPGFASPDPTILDYQGYITYVDDKLPPG
jgi:hypothetical protein